MAERLPLVVAIDYPKNYQSISTNSIINQNQHSSLINQTPENTIEEENHISIQTIIMKPKKEGIDKIIFFNSFNTLLGISAFTMPWGFQLSGVLGGFLVVLLVAISSFETSRILIVAQYKIYSKTGAIYSYPEIAAEYLGYSIGCIVKISTVISCFGGCIGSLIFMASLLIQIINIDMTTSLLILAIPLILLSLVRSFKELSVMSLISFLSIILSILTLLIDGYNKSKTQINHYNPSKLLSPINAQYSHHNIISVAAIDFIGPMTFLFTIHYILLSMSEEILKESKLKQSNINLPNINPSSATNNLSSPKLSSATNNQSSFSSANHQMDKGHVRRIIFPLGASYICSGLVLVLLGVLGYRWYRNSSMVKDIYGNVLPGCENIICENILLNLSAGILRNIIVISLLLSITIGFIIIFSPAREHVEDFIISRIFGLPPISSACKTAVENVIRVSLVMITVLVAIEYPYFSDVLGSVGGITDALQSFVIPPLVYIEMCGDKMDGKRKLLYRLLALFGVGIIFHTLGKAL